MPNAADETRQILDPVRYISEDDAAKKPKPGIALCLSGGGYRAMLFHVGSIWRLNELGYLKKLIRISSVSGGSITAGMLGLKWTQLQWDAAGVATNFAELVAQPIIDFAGQTIDEKSIVLGALVPFETISDFVAHSYKKYLYGDATLQDLPSDDQGPRFVINATNVQTKVLWRFSKPFMGDYRIGLIHNPTVPLAVAVGASSAFPPVLSPVKLKLDPAQFDKASAGDLQRAPFTTEATLSDGGVYDNLGLETCWKEYDTILVSDGGGATADEEHPHTDWARHSYRILQLLDNQVGSLRKRWVIGSYKIQLRQGTYWGIRSNVADYQLGAPMDCLFAKTLPLANTPTRLKAMDTDLKQKLVNWGYAICDTAMRKHVTAAAAAGKFPFAIGIG